MLNLWKTQAVLMHHHALGSPHEVTVGPVEDDDWGSLVFDEEADVFRIRVSDKLDEKSGVEVLLHEWAHALLHEYNGPYADAVWGVCYAGLFHLIYGDH